MADLVGVAEHHDVLDLRLDWRTQLGLSVRPRANTIKGAPMIFAIDPGPIDSAYCIVGDDYVPRGFGKIDNRTLLGQLDGEAIDRVVIEWISSYGMPVGEEVFDTCLWVGRFYERLVPRGIRAKLIKRGPIKLHHCGSTRAKDPNITQALVDRFAPGQPNHGKGTKANPGFFYGFKADVWAAFALAVYAIDTQEAAA